VSAWALCLVAASLALSACRERTPPAESSPTSPPGRTASAPIAWRALGTWSGHGDSQTESFNVETGALRLRWETSNENPPGEGRFRVSLHSAISGRPLQTVVDDTGTGKDTSFLQDDPRVSYLVIESRNVDWTATLEEVVR
jgi:hypothetical protein